MLEKCKKKLGGTPRSATVHAISSFYYKLIFMYIKSPSKIQTVDELIQQLYP